MSPSAQKMKLKTINQEQSDEQSTEGTDQVEQQSEDQPSSEADQQTDQGDATPSDEGDQPTEEPVQVAEADEEQADQGGGGSMGAADNLASDTVPSAGGAGATKVGTRNLKVIAEFTEQGQKFIGDILIHVFESDNGQQGRLLRIKQLAKLCQCGLKTPSRHG